MALQFPPWRHDSELAMVRDWFFPKQAKQELYSTVLCHTSRDLRQRAIDRVSLWLFKAGQLPPALVATASLTDALIHDEQRRSLSGTAISELAMQSIYAMAFARFVNGFVDRDVARSYAAEMARDNTPEGEEVPRISISAAKGESSMYAHAATIGMPQNFVDLRHQVTHADIPNLVYLRKMTELALDWIWERWWVKNVTGDPERALRELEDRRRISREARNGAESSKDDSTNMADASDSHGQTLPMKATLGLSTAQNESDFSSPAGSRNAPKRKSTALEDNN
ncbi:uncharacterized protein Z520_00740 [Fonsecaea multimorphosa CBS 102226]|uniref:Uncharacterized protein n=1 Tax=Fonsecaea multimorphosa CBS 102226 TaxID=1442371 RepID=A0A0D2KD41_9EURO|nr:uncharacterized protein Z520_00740 [Fonsecaea multimorphosa CBS 102226]KIY04048.1 hypothetical protein Z520_00740 [Fonsecaea multimorphosa CBS 102226]OAL31884.1 hypothetical protein AYO22_00754 [Fonsecaea multimorphosa]